MGTPSDRHSDASADSMRPYTYHPSGPSISTPPITHYPQYTHGHSHAPRHVLTERTPPPPIFQPDRRDGRPQLDPRQMVPLSVLLNKDSERPTISSSSSSRPQSHHQFSQVGHQSVQNQRLPRAPEGSSFGDTHSDRSRQLWEQERSRDEGLTAEVARLRLKLFSLEKLFQEKEARLLGDVSEAEEARMLQYRCETFETWLACHDVDITSDSFIDDLKRYAGQEASLDYCIWLDRHMREQDPVIRSARRQNPEYVQRIRPVYASFKCYHEACPHYIYGFSTVDAREIHIKEHHSLVKRESLQSIPTPAIPEYTVKSEPRDGIYTGSSISETWPQPRETKVTGDIGPCLRCKLTNKQCDLVDPCESCTKAVGPGDKSDEDYWKSVGCLRDHDSLAKLADRFITKWPVSSRVASPSDQRHIISAYLDKHYHIPHHIQRSVLNGLDFNDDFWFTDQVFPPQQLRRDRPQVAPHVLAVLLNSHNTEAVAYNFMDVIHCSATLSQTRAEEEQVVPVLYAAKVLLRQTLYCDLAQSVPVVVSLDGIPERAEIELDGVDRVRLFRQVLESLQLFLEAFQAVALNKVPLTAKDWFAGFFSVCIFSIVKNILAERAMLSLTSRSRDVPSEVQVMDDIYRVIVTIFARASPIIQESGHVSLSPQEKAIMKTIDRIMVRAKWSQYRTRTESITDFLVNLGSRGVDPQGFVCTVAPNLRPQMALPLLDTTLGHANVDVSQPLDSPGEHALRSDSYLGTRTPIGDSPRRTYRPSQSRKFSCDRCSDGSSFRSETELRRHCNAQHGPARKFWMIREPVGLPSDVPRPTVSLSGCKCRTRHFGTSSAAVEHLRRHHFTPGYTSGRRPTSAGISEQMLREWWVVGRWDYGEAEVSDEDVQDGRGYHGSSVSMASPASASVGSVAETPRHLGYSGMVSDSAVSAYNSPVLGHPPHSIPNRLVEGMHLPGLPKPPTSNHNVPRYPHETPSVSRGGSPVIGSLPPLGARQQPLSHLQFVPGYRHKPVYGSPHVEPTTPSDPPASQPYSPPPTRTPENRSRCPFPTCGRTYKDLAAHMLTHQEQRPEKCPIEVCEYHTKGFARKYDKNRHALTHYKGTMICPFCSAPTTLSERTFNRADIFKKHLTARHGVEQAPPNSRRPLPRIGAGIEGDTGSAGPRCSICKGKFVTPQEFYEHLDECVLNEIIPGGGAIIAAPPVGREWDVKGKGAAV